jgi:dinuclear metal center YbgI/SA1388 family protein
MISNGQSIIQLLEEWMPKYLAMEDDRIGLQIGTLQKPVKKVMVTLDVLENVVDEAIEHQVDLIISHHAIIYKALKHLRTDLPAGRIYEKLLKHDIAVYVAHTNFDSAEGGMNDLFAERLGLQNTEVLSPVYTHELRKIVVFVPETHHEQVLKAMGDAGAGWIGNYSHCTFNTPGFGTFIPQEGTNPFIGQQGKLEKVNEIRLETIMPKVLVKKVVSAMLKAHPYEEVAYDIYPVDQVGKNYGIGRIGTLPEPITLADLAKKVMKAFDLEGVRFVGEKERLIKKVAVVGGAGRDYIHQAAFKGADCLVTGDIGYHDGHEAMSLGITLIDGGHHMEKIMKEAVADRLRNALVKAGSSTEVIVSNAPTDPFHFMM